MLRGKRKSVSPRGSRPESVNECCSCVPVIYTWIFKMAAVWARANQIILWQAERGERLGLQAAKFVGKASWNCLWIFSSAERKKGIQNKFGQARRKRKRGVRKRKWNKGKEYGCRPVSKWIKNGQAAFPYRLGNEVMTTSSWLVVEPIVLNHISTLLEILLSLLFVQFQSFSFLLYTISYQRSSSQVSQYHLQFSC